MTERVSKTELHMFRSGKQVGMSRMLGTIFFSMIPAALASIFCNDVATAIATFSAIVSISGFCYLLFSKQQQTSD